MAGHLPARQVADHGDQPHRDPALGTAPQRDQRRRRAAEDPPVPDRTTHLSLRDKSAWAGRGRATIDPNHSPEVEGDHYLTAATPAQQQAVEAIVADAQHDLIRRTHPLAVLTGGDAASLARDYPQLVAATGLDDTVLAELVGGERDVFTAACADQLSGLHGPKGLPGQAVGLPALPAGDLRPPPRRQPAAAEGVLLPAMAADALRPVHGRLRPLLPAGRPGPRPLRPRRPGPGCPPGHQRRQRDPATPRGEHTMTAALPALAPSPGRSPFAGADVCQRAGAHPPSGNPQAGLRQRPLGLHRRDRAPRLDAPLCPPVRFLPDHQPAMADHRQGADLRDAGPAARGGGAAPARGRAAPRCTSAPPTDAWARPRSS